MTTTNYNTTEFVQELSDAELQQINGGFVGRFFRWVAKAFRRAPRPIHQTAQQFRGRRVDSFDYTEVNL